MSIHNKDIELVEDQLSSCITGKQLGGAEHLSKLLLNLKLLKAIDLVLSGSVEIVMRNSSSTPTTFKIRKV